MLYAVKGLLAVILLTKESGAINVNSDQAKYPFRPSPEVIEKYRPSAPRYGTDLPEWGKNVSQIIGDVYQYPVEVHNVTTGDGYILSMQRIPRGINEKPGASSQPRSCVFVQHGLMATSMDWIRNLPNESIAYILADNGFDVWLGNSRGNSYSLQHTTLDVDSQAFWNFTWQDMARDDLPSMLRYITNATGQSACHYIGHSQGTLIAFAALSTDASFQKMIKKYIALAPIHNMGNCHDTFLHALAPYEREIIAFSLDEHQSDALDFERALLDKEGDYSSGDVLWFLDYIRPICYLGPKFLNKCDAIFLNWNGPEQPGRVNETRIPLFIQTKPDLTSVKNVGHFMQLVDSNKMQKYDYGHVGNLNEYGQVSPPVYDVTKIPNQMVFYYSQADASADVVDVRALIDLMPNVHVHMLTDYSHDDFTWSLDAAQRVYKSAIQHLKDYDTLNKN